MIDHIEEITEHVERGGTVTPSGAPPCANFCAKAWEEEHRPIKGLASSEELWRDFNRLRKAAKVARIARGVTVVGLTTVAGEFLLKEGLKLFSGSRPEGSRAGEVTDQRMWLHVAGTRLQPQDCCDVSRFVTPVHDYYQWEYQWNNGASWWPMARTYPGSEPYWPPDPPASFQDIHQYGVADGSDMSHIGIVDADEVFANAPVEDYAGQPYTVEIAPPPQPSHTTVVEDVRTFLDSPEGEKLQAWYRWELGDVITDPYSGEGSATAPGCDGVTFDPCAQRFRDAGFSGTIKREFASFEQADLTRSAGEVLKTDPALGGRTPAGRTVTITTNPLEADMPVLVPTPAAAPGESFAAYAQRVADLGPSAVRVVAAEHDYDYGDDAVLAVNPAEGTRVRRDAELRVTANPPRTDNRHPDCERYEQQPGEPTPPPNDPYEIKRYTLAIGAQAEESFQRNTGLGYETIYLRWGRTFLDSNGNWAGWGYRHIAAKHGWDDQDRRDTIAALLLPEVPALSNADKKVHIGPEYDGRNGTRCRRLVVVRVTRDTREIEQNSPAKHIITAYAEGLTG